MKVPNIPYVQGRNDYDDRDDRKYGMAIHNTSNNASDENEASYATRRTDGISSHFYADKDSVIQSIDTNDRVGHAGSYEGNEHAVAYELMGGNGSSRAWWLANVAWVKLASVIAYQLKHDPDFAGFQIRRASVTEMKANPKIKAFYGHDDMRRAWGGTTHTDPGPNFPWDKLIAEVKTAMGVTPTPAPKPTPTPTTDWTVKLIMALPTLREGSRGTDVKRVQALLNVLGSRLTEDGDFGNGTESAVKSFQRSKSLPADGIVGPKTWTKLLGE